MRMSLLISNKWKFDLNCYMMFPLSLFEDPTISRILAHYVPDRYLHEREQQTASMLVEKQGGFRAMTETWGGGCERTNQAERTWRGWRESSVTVWWRHPVVGSLPVGRETPRPPFEICENLFLVVYFDTRALVWSFCEREGNRAEFAQANKQRLRERFFQLTGSRLRRLVFCDGYLLGPRFPVPVYNIKWVHNRIDFAVSILFTVWNFGVCGSRNLVLIGTEYIVSRCLATPSIFFYRFKEILFWNLLNRRAEWIQLL